MSKEKQKLEGPEVCPKCGEEFHCSTSSKCWCYEIYVPTKIREQIDERYDSCLCKECLEEEINE